MIGEAGTGKTTLMQAALADVPPDSVRVVLMSNPTLTRSEFYEFLARAFGLSQEAGESKTRFLFDLRRELQERQQGRRAERARHRRGAEHPVRAPRGDPAAEQHRDDDDEAAERDPGRAARAVGPVERHVAAAVEAADRAAVPADADGS